ncbi:MAG: DNA repair protein RadA [Clostridiales bacterium]|nr:DNA repair protein RadA [Clostridiales bacterium]MCF8023632.1 DNA repair protein RadA [Clostridiales bacterium]
MTKKSVFYCQECSHKVPRWMGRCPNCGSWNSIIEEKHPTTGKRQQNERDPGNDMPRPITEIIPISEERFSTGISEVDRVMGGGVVPGSLVLLGGDPGIGKSTILLQVAGSSGKTNQCDVLYVSGEESVRQIRLRADRLGVLQDNIYVCAETEAFQIERYILDISPRLVVIDSIQTMYNPEVSAAPGSVSQVRECTYRLMNIAKSTNTSIILVGHVTKEGMLAGPKVLEHMVDVVLQMEGQKEQGFRLLRGEKNRFGSTNEIGVFDMQESGLIEVANPSSLFMMAHAEEVPGAVVVSTMEGTRPLLVEIQALVCSSGFGVPKRMTTGLDANRSALIMAVLEKRVGLQMGGHDAYINVVGGVRIYEPAVDLGVAVSLASSFRDRAVEKGTAVMGEIGLTGEIRSVSSIEKRVREAKYLGFQRCLIPSADIGQLKDNYIDVEGVKTVGDAIERALKV